MFAASTDPAVLPTSTARNQLCAVQVDHEQTRLDAVLEREQSVAIADLLEDNLFELIGRDSGPTSYVYRPAVRSWRFTS